ncbi:MAG: extracellular solute-binding protein [Lachnospiraceae bacterium]|nr:extracellular solute-binding protein [Lachnospiraceae bacterium]
MRNEIVTYGVDMNEDGGYNKNVSAGFVCGGQVGKYYMLHGRERGGKMRKNNGKNREVICLLMLICLFAGMCFSGCGKEDEQPDQESRDEQESQTDQENPVDPEDPDGEWSLDSGTLRAGYRSVSMDMDILGMENQLLDMKCMAAEGGIYVTGARLNQGEMETAVYWIPSDQEPRQLLSIPQEKQMAWCKTPEGIAVLGMQAEVTEQDIKRLFTLHVFRGENLEQEETWDLTEAVTAAGVTDKAFSAMAVEGKELLLAVQSDKTLLVIDLSAGTVEQTIAVASDPECLRYIDEEHALGISANGVLYAFTPKNGGWEVKSDKVIAQSGTLQHCVIGEKWILGGSRTELYAVPVSGSGTVNTEKERKIMDYEYGLEPGSSLWFDEESSQGILATWDQDKRKIGLYFLSGSALAEKEDDREVITMSGFDIMPEMMADVAEFNQYSDKYRVEVTEAEGADIEDIVLRLETQLMAGQGSDLLVVNTWTWFQDYVANGYLEDLMPYIRRDLNPEDYVQSALYAYEKDGSVYALQKAFGLGVLISDTRVTKGAASWDLQEMYRLAEGSKVPFFLTDLDRVSVLKLCLQWMGDGIFDLEQVKESILFAGKYGNDPAKNLINLQEARLGEDYMTDDRTISNPLALADLEMYYGENTVVIGYPRDWGYRAVQGNNGAPSINAASTHKEGAWTFIRFLLEREQQFAIGDTEGFPVLKEAFDQRLEKYLKPMTYDIYLPEAGGIITVENTYSLPRSMSSIESMTQEQIDRLRTLVDDSGVSVWQHMEVSDIVVEEASAYYQGDKTIEDVMDAIRGRVEMYTSERE